MSVFTIERALQPQGGGSQQLFIVFMDTTEGKDMDAFCQTIAKTFSSAAIVVATPSDALTHAQALQQEQVLTDEELKTFVSNHHSDIQGFIKAFQAHLKIEPNATALIGVGQMGALVMELAKLETPLAGRLIGFGTRFAQMPNAALSLEQTIHLLHARHDKLVDVSYTAKAQEVIAHFEGDATIDVAHQAKDSFDQTLVQQMVQRLLTCVPLRYWKEAQNAQVLDAAPAEKGEAIH